jgi:hypothetical protein
MPQLAKEYTNPAEVLFNSTELGTPKDLNELQNLVRRNLGFLLDAALSGGAQLRAFGDALKVTADGATMDLTVTGLAPILWRLAADPGAPDPQVLMHQLGADDTFTVDAADGSNPRIDVFSATIEDADVGDSESRIVKDGTTGAITSQSLDKRTRTKLTVTYTPGTPAASPVAPSPPAGEVVFAEVLVDTGVALIEQADVTDLRSRFGIRAIREILSLASGDTLPDHAAGAAFAGAGSGPDITLKANPADGEIVFMINTSPINDGEVTPNAGQTSAGPASFPAAAQFQFYNGVWYRVTGGAT